MEQYVEVDIKEVERFVNNPDFHSYILAHVSDFNSALFILQTLLNAVKQAKEQSQGETD